jgi:hypothetical protein
MMMKHGTPKAATPLASALLRLSLSHLARFDPSPAHVAKLLVTGRVHSLIDNEAVREVQGAPAERRYSCITATLEGQQLCCFAGIETYRCSCKHGTVIPHPSL